MVKKKNRFPLFMFFYSLQRTCATTFKRDPGASTYLLVTKNYKQVSSWVGDSMSKKI